MIDSARTKLVAAAAAAAAATCLLVPAAALAASIGGFSVRPAHFNAADPVTRAYFKPTIARGGSYRDQVIITNTGTAPIELRVDAVDGVTGVTSGAVYANRQVTEHGAALWVHPAVMLVRIPTRQQVKVSFVVRVPANATPGDHLAGLAFQNTRARRSTGKFSITEIVRDVVGVEIKVPGRAAPRIQLQGLALRALPGTAFPSVVIRLGDSGGLLCKPRLAVAMSGPGGSLRVVRQLDTILPGDVIPYPLPWPRPLRAGHYTATVRATSCGPAVAITRAATLGTTLAGTNADPAGPKPPASSSGNPPWALIFVGLGGLAAGLLISRRRRPSRPTPTF